MLYHLDGTDVGYVLICIQIKSSAFEGFYWNIVEETSSSQRLYTRQRSHESYLVNCLLLEEYV